VHTGDSAEVRLTAYPDKVLRARVSNIGRVLDPATRSAKVRLELENRSAILRPGMFATVSFRSQQSEDHAVVPFSGIMRLHDKDWVFIALEGNKFRRTEVQVGPRQKDGQQEVLSGVRAGDRVVANALEFSASTEK
jgi:cobalt-zinc-cadmium efflux system membrane fusion protein